MGVRALAATVVWNGPGSGTNDWSVATNWSLTTPGPADDVRFYDSGTASAASNLTSVVDAAFAGTIGSLQFGPTNGFHTTLLWPGTTLAIGGAGGLMVGTAGDPGAAKVVHATVTGSGATLSLSNLSGSLVVNQGTATNVSGSRAVLDLSGLDRLMVNARRLGIGTTTLPNPGGANQRVAGTLYLARTNLISLAYAVPRASYPTLAAATNALEISLNPGNNGSTPSSLYLGVSNAFCLDSIGIGRAKSSPASAGVLAFNPAFTNAKPVAWFRGIAGGTNRVSWWAVGDMGAFGSSAQVATGTNDFSFGTVDALVDTLVLGRDANNTQTAGGYNRGVLTFTAGIIDINSAQVGSQAFGVSNLTPCAGVLNVNGADATLRVNQTLELAHTTLSSPAATNTTGTLNVVGGAVLANTVLAGPRGVSALNVKGGILAITNTAGTPALPLTQLALTEATLWLAASNWPAVNARSLVTGSGTNRIVLGDVPPFPSYPTQLTLIQYSGTIGGTGYNFVLDPLPPPTTGFLLANAANHSVDVVFTSGSGIPLEGLSLAFTTQPAAAWAGQPLTPPVVVQVRDTETNPAPAYGLVISLSLTNGTGSLKGTTNILTDVNGRATFTDLSFTEAGWKQLAAYTPGLPPSVSALFYVSNVPTMLTAFPGAEGAGANALGGRGGDVYYVTNLNDSGAGSLRAAISSATGPRTILFKVSGNISLASNLTLNKPRITIAGQSAPGDGICLRNYSLIIQANDAVVRHIRARLGTNAMQESDSIWINGGANVILDHCSASWSVDETLSATSVASNLTVQWTYITESLNNSIHSKGTHGYGSLITPAVNTTFSWHHNLYAHHNSRNPRPGSDSGAVACLDFRNNALYNWGDRAGYGSDWDPDPERLRLNYVANCLVAGPSSEETRAFLGGGTNTILFQVNNAIDLNRNHRFDGADTGWAMFGGTFVSTNAAFAAPAVTTDAPAVAWQRVLAQAGAMPWRRDPVDRRVTETVRNHTGQIIDTPAQVGGYPTLTAAAPPADADNDGMPDYWELALGLDPNNPADRNLTNGLGYTRLEDYLNWLAEPHALCDRNGLVDVDLGELNGGATNLVYTVSSGLNGMAALLPNGYTVRFVPATAYSGLAGFSYTAFDTANSAGFGPVTVNVLVSVTNAPNSPPVLAPIPDTNLLAGSMMTFTNVVVDTDQPPQTITFLLLNAPSNASLNPTNGVFSWRPAIAQSSSTHVFSIVARDNGIPSLGATQTFTVSVRRPDPPQVEPQVSTNGQFSMLISGDAGPDYLVQASTNFEAWVTLTTNVSPTLPWLWSDPESGRVPARFYRVLLGP